ncbi:MAG: septum formation protein Maf [Alphaproteobacteria bacterium]|nr:septum formation protein Maf [Alphaproteobacteria bacterium]
MTLTLASGSPRRRHLLEQLGYALQVAPQDIDETPHAGEPPLDYARRMAVEKAQSFSGAGPVLSADTVVHRGARIFGKPEDEADAVAMLGELADGWHEVTTATCLRWPGGERVRLVTTSVRFRAASQAELRGYVATGEPADKAGAYGIQGIGGFLVAELRGSYSNVVGLPLVEVLEDLQAAGLPAPLSASPVQEGGG